MSIFVVPGNRQALLGMPDMEVFNIIKININSIGAEDAGDNSKWCANMYTGSPNQSRKQTGLRSATQTWTVFQN